MNTRLVAAFVAALVMVSPALAADLVVEQPPVAVPGESFDWEGAYIGAFAGADRVIDSGNTYGAVGARVGYNIMLSEGFLAGIEADAEYLDGPNGAFKQVALIGRAGFLATDALWLYARGAVGTEFNPSNDTRAFYGVGIGAEFAVTDQVSLTADFGGGNYFDGNDEFFGSAVATAGVNFHF